MKSGVLNRIMDIIRTIAEELHIRPEQANAAVKLIDEGNTSPFIARYRKEMTGSLNDEVLRDLHARLQYLRSLEERREAVLSAIEEQGKLSPELKKQILEAATLAALEDLYRPYRPKRRTRASIAREKGLEPLAALIRRQELSRPSLEEAARFVSEEKGVASAEEALAGARDIIAEEISDNAMYRRFIRARTWQDGCVVSEAKASEASSAYENYYSFSEPVRKIAGYRVLALDRGEKEKYLTVKIEPETDRIVDYLQKQVVTKNNPFTSPELCEASRDAYERLIRPSIEREIRSALTEAAEDNAIGVFGKNLAQLLMQPPVEGHTVLGWDPAFRTGCKLAVADPTGKILDTAVVFPTPPASEAKRRAAIDTVKKLIDRYHVSLISVGNGTASRESEQVIAEIIREIPDKKVSYVITNEAGASVYSASALASEEFPQFDVGQRSAASIARRVQDPLAELVKIDPKSIGVGQYQHDMNQKKLAEALEGVVENCVNRVGVDLNTASAALLKYVAGISAQVARNIVAYREENGRFDTRRQLLKVKGLGPKAFEQSAGFLRIRGGSEPFDATGIHPESFSAAEGLLESLGMDRNCLREGSFAAAERLKGLDIKKMALRLGVGEETLRDIAAELARPGRDPRRGMPPVVLRGDVLDIKDLKEGMVLKGTVRNVVDFGAFVDIGVHQDGLVHISQLTDKKFVKHPLEVVSVGDIVEVKVISLDLRRNRIGLSMRTGGNE